MDSGFWVGRGIDVSITTGGWMKTIWQTVSLDDVLAYFAKGWNHKDSGELWSHESYVDISKRQVVFRLDFVDDDAARTAGRE